MKISLGKYEAWKILIYVNTEFKCKLERVVESFTKAVISIHTELALTNKVLVNGISYMVSTKQIKYYIQMMNIY